MISVSVTTTKKCLTIFVCFSDVSFGEPSSPGDSPSNSYSSPGYSSPYYPGYGDDSNKKRKPSYGSPYYPRM